MKVIETHGAITADVLTSLVNRRCIVARVKDFFPHEAGARIAKALIESDMYGKYANASKIGRVGQAFFETTASATALAEYFSNATEWIRALREAFQPYQPPVDKLRLQLDECWSHGANLARLSGRKMYAGLVRAFDEGATAEPHQDHLDWDAAHHEIYSGAYFNMQLAANVYLLLSESGGELVVWPDSLTKLEYENRRIQNSYGVTTAGLGDPIILRPEPGELVIFDSRRVHQVLAPRGGVRVAASCFIGYTDSDSPLSIWS